MKPIYYLQYRQYKRTSEPGFPTQRRLARPRWEARRGSGSAGWNCGPVSGLPLR